MNTIDEISIYRSIHFVVPIACQSNDSKYIIKGTLPTAQQDGEWIYLAPMENASIENIDSTRNRERTYFPKEREKR